MKPHHLLLLLLCGLFAVAPAHARLAPDRWTRLTEEERHQLTRAERYFEQSNFKSAKSEYELFLQLHTKSEVASYAQLMFGECTRRLGQVNGAIGEFRSVIDYFPDSIDAGSAQYSIGVCQTQTGDTEEAVKAFEKVITQWPTNDFGASARSEVCAIYWRLGKVEQWVPHMAYLATGAYADPQNLHHTAQHRLLMHRLVERKTAEGYALIESVRPKDALLVFAQWSADAMHGHHIPTFYGEKGTKARHAIAADAVSFIEKQPTTDAAQKAALEHWSARIFAYAGDVTNATQRFAVLTKKHPDDDTIRTEYAAYLRSSGKRPEARLVYRELKDQYVADRNISETYGEEGNWKSCLEGYQAMLGKHPKQSDAIQWRMGEVLQQRLGKYPEAIACYNQSQSEPQSLFRISECQGAMKQHDAAIQTLVGVLNFFKSAAPEAQYRIASHYAAKGDKEAAIRTLKTLCKVYLNTSWAGRAHQDLTLTYGVDVTLGGAAKKEEK